MKSKKTGRYNVIVGKYRKSFGYGTFYVGKADNISSAERLAAVRSKPGDHVYLKINNNTVHSGTVYNSDYVNVHTGRRFKKVAWK